MSVIGLEFIAKTFGMEYQEIAKHLSITPPAIQGWLKGRRKIPPKRLAQLESLFGIESDYFQKELSTADKLYIQRKNAERLSREEAEEVEYTYVDDNGQERTGTTYYNPYEGVLNEIVAEEKKAILLEQVADILNNGDSNRRALLEIFLETMKRGNKDELTVLTKVINYLNDRLDPFADFDAEKEQDRKLYEALNNLVD
ncbi:helix-turn-helix domain-containing protein [Alicyclobacillus dauci]|uniref:Helix-turn-helix domain-containing protein n=1 Tax=Alicyclobacillus dauci TaxID=1475485 RepID=A0ABY6Z8A4_9BACL|nr:helix-turn-helix domain-containing protein [Alicyclobacillus dauci]WAH39024.1 helix-turn-helix domain-containing protein [Alicyclobacillus dauci]